jgi:hypothetical protein
MNVGDSVRKAIDDWEQGELESSMLHACNAVDGTAKKLYPLLGSNERLLVYCARAMECLGLWEPLELI